jgi:hypothetical protein
MRTRFPEFHIVNLFGGTGNQLFQLAHAHKISSTRKKVWVFLVKPSLRGAVHNFEIEELLSRCQHLIMLNSIVSSIFRFLFFIRNRMRSRLPFFLSSRAVRSRFKFLSIHSDYFQSFESLIDIESQFLEELKSFLDVHSRNKRFDFELVLHVRAGDYFSHLQTYGVLTEHYYNICLGMLPPDAKRSAAIFFDTSSPALLALSLSNNFVLLGPESANALDLLSAFHLSRHCIVGNSTLSWWGGLLAKSNGAQVFVPTPWHKALKNDFDEANSHFGFTLVQSSYL